jgi:hypothetical protein
VDDEHGGQLPRRLRRLRQVAAGLAVSVRRLELDVLDLDPRVLRLDDLASTNFGLSWSRSIAAVTPPTAYFAALSRNPRRSSAPCTYASNRISSSWSKS